MFPWNGGAEHAEFATLTEQEILERTGGRSPRFVPGPDDDPRAAEQNDRQGREIIGVLRAAAGEMELVAEIMGRMPDYIRRAIDDLQMPSLTFPQLERTADGELLPPSEYRPLSLATYANHDHAPLAALYAHFRAQAAEAPGGFGTVDLSNLLDLAEWRQSSPVDFNEELLTGFQRGLFASPCQLAVLLSSDLVGSTQRFNLPGSYGEDTWNERLEMPLAEYARHPVFGPRIQTARELINESGRAAGR